MDNYGPYIPRPDQYPWTQPPIQTVPPAPAPMKRWPTFDELNELLESFRDAVRAAEAFDRLTGQPDCVDPEKAALEERVAELERKLEEMAA
jgi:hypothetical protein